MRPKIICHMISSIDGRLIADRWTSPPKGATHDIILKTYEETAARIGAQGWIVGRKTMENMLSTMPGSSTAPLPSPSTARHEHIGDRQARSLAVAVDPGGKLHYGKGHIGNDHVVAILGEGVSDQYLQRLREDGVSYFFASLDGKNLPAAMQSLGTAFGIDTLLLEGGGITNGAFLKADLIDEISLLIYPGIDGLSGIPSIFEYHGSQNDQQPALGRSLRLLSAETLNAGFVWLRYSIDRPGQS